MKTCSRPVKLITIADVTNFVHEASKVDGDVICHKGKYAVDGKSLLGVISIDMSVGVVTVEYPEDAIQFERFLEDLY